MTAAVTELTIEHIMTRVRDEVKGGRSVNEAVRRCLSNVSASALRELVAEYLRFIGEQVLRAQEREARVAAWEAAQNTPEAVAARQAKDEELARSEAEWRREADDRRREREARYHRGLMAILDDYASHLRMEWTQELMESTFGLADGTRVQWAVATVADHKAHMAMVTTQVQGQMRDLGLHQAAIDEINRHAAARCLADVVEFKGGQS